MPFEKKVDAEAKATVRMKYVGHFKGLHKIVELPIPLLSNSQKFEQTIVFLRPINTGPALADVPLEWVGALLNVGGNWQLNEKVTPEVQTQIDVAYQATISRMEKFALDNEMVEA